MTLARRKRHTNKTTTKRTTQTTLTRPMTGADAFEAGRRAYEAAVSGYTGAGVPKGDRQRARVTVRTQYDEAGPHEE
jgi:hypothetical protein